MKPTGSIFELKNQALLIMISEHGQLEFIEMINNWLTMGKITKKQAFDLRKQIKLVGQPDSKYVLNPLIEELDYKIKIAARFN